VPSDYAGLFACDELQTMEANHGFLSHESPGMSKCLSRKFVVKLRNLFPFKGYESQSQAFPIFRGDAP
jgi:hypothetical protein